MLTFTSSIVSICYALVGGFAMSPDSVPTEAQPTPTPQVTVLEVVAEPQDEGGPSEEEDTDVSPEAQRQRRQAQRRAEAQRAEAEARRQEFERRRAERQLQREQRQRRQQEERVEEDEESESRETEQDPIRALQRMEESRDRINQLYREGREDEAGELIQEAWEELRSRLGRRLLSDDDTRPRREDENQRPSPEEVLMRQRMQLRALYGGNEAEQAVELLRRAGMEDLADAVAEETRRRRRARSGDPNVAALHEQITRLHHEVLELREQVRQLERLQRQLVQQLERRGPMREFRREAMQPSGPGGGRFGGPGGLFQGDPPRRDPPFNFDRPDRPDQPDRPDRPDRPDQPDRPDRPDRPDGDRPDGEDREGDRGEREDRQGDEPERERGDGDNSGDEEDERDDAGEGGDDGRDV